MRRIGALGGPVPVVMALAVALAAAACSPARPDLTDPNEILAQAAAQIDRASSVRLTLDVSGAIALDLVGSGTARPLLLEGTTLTADLDLAGGAMKATFAAPALLGLTGEYIAPGGRAYLQMSLIGPKFVALDPDAAAPGASPGPGASGSGSSSPAISLAGLTDLLADPSVVATKLDDADCGNVRCYRVRVEVDPSALDLGLPDIGALAGILGPAGLPELSGAIGFTIGVGKEDLRPAWIESDIVLGDSATLELLLAFSGWNDPVAVDPPPADRVDDTGDLSDLLFPFAVPQPLPTTP